jgi:intracellular multiplication protein IcmJ
LSSLALTLGVGREPDAKFSSLSSSELRAQQQRTLQRDAYTCQCCGFKAKRFQQVIPVQGKLQTVCFFCEQCFSLDAAASSGAGVLIWLPEISQTDLHHLVRAIYVARSSEHHLASTASRAFDLLMARRSEAKRRLGSDDPVLLATALQEGLNDAEYKKRTAKLEGIRLLPVDKKLVATAKGVTDAFSQILNFWRSPEGPFGKLPVEEWEKMFAAVPAK